MIDPDDLPDIEAFLSMVRGQAMYDRERRGMLAVARLVEAVRGGESEAFDRGYKNGLADGEQHVEEAFRAGFDRLRKWGRMDAYEHDPTTLDRLVDGHWADYLASKRR